ncbi:MAG: hypothetical protein ACE5RM_02650, partial [Candidatus Nitrosomaritimum aestuariumsis]
CAGRQKSYGGVEIGQFKVEKQTKAFEIDTKDNRLCRNYNNEIVNHQNGILVTNGLIHNKILEEFKKLD